MSNSNNPESSVALPSLSNTVAGRPDAEMPEVAKPDADPSSNQGLARTSATTTATAMAGINTECANQVASVPTPPVIVGVSASATTAAEVRGMELWMSACQSLQKLGNPFQQQFARNSDDPYCSIFHVEDLFSQERLLLQGLVESYRGDPTRPTSVLPLLGARGAGKTHLLHSLKHGPGVAPELFVTPGTFRIDPANTDSSFLEYVLYQFINVLLAGSEQRGVRPLVYVGEQLTRQTLIEALGPIGQTNQATATAAGRKWPQWGELLRWGNQRQPSRASLEELRRLLARSPRPCVEIVRQLQFDPEQLITATAGFLEQCETRDLRGEFRKRIIQGFIRVTLLGEDSMLADYLTDGFAEVPFLVKPTRTQLTLTLLQALTELIVGSGIPVAVAFDQLEELLYGQTEEEIRRSSDAFFGGMVQLMSQVPGLCLLMFAEEGLWHRIVPPLPPHILDRIYEPVHLGNRGLVREMCLSKPTVEQLIQVVHCRVQRTFAERPEFAPLPPEFPFTRPFLSSLVQRESVLRLMLQGCCNRLDEMLHSLRQGVPLAEVLAQLTQVGNEASHKPQTIANIQSALPANTPAATGNGEAPPTMPIMPAAAVTSEPAELSPAEVQRIVSDLTDRWHQEVRAATRKLKPVGSLAAATVELQGGLVRWLRLCRELGVEQEDWRLATIRDQVRIGEHPSYGTLTGITWTNQQNATQTVGLGLWLGRGVGKLKDLETKLQVFQLRQRIVDHLILLRPADDARLSGRTETAWEQAIQQGYSVRMEAVDLDVFAKLYAFPRWMQQLADSYPDVEIPDEVFVFLAEQTEAIMLRLGLPQHETVRAA